MGDDAGRQLCLALAPSSSSWVELDAFCCLSKLLKFGFEWKQADWNAAEVVVSASNAFAPFLCRLLTWSIVTIGDDSFLREMRLMKESFSFLSGYQGCMLSSDMMPITFVWAWTDPLRIAASPSWGTKPSSLQEMFRQHQWPCVIFRVVLKMQRHELVWTWWSLWTPSSSGYSMIIFPLKRQTDCLRRVLHAPMGSPFLGKVCG